MPNFPQNPRPERQSQCFNGFGNGLDGGRLRQMDQTIPWGRADHPLGASGPGII